MLIQDTTFAFLWIICDLLPLCTQELLPFRLPAYPVLIIRPRHHFPKVPILGMGEEKVTLPKASQQPQAFQPEDPPATLEEMASEGPPHCNISSYHFVH